MKVNHLSVPARWSLLPSFALACALSLLTTVVSPAAAKNPTPGSVCRTVGKEVSLTAKKYIKCTIVGKKLVWSKPQWRKSGSAADVIDLTMPSPPTPTPTPTVLKPEPAWLSRVLPLNAGSAIQYTSFDRETFTLFPWQGRRIAVLTLRSDLDPVAMGKITEALDMAYEEYQDITGFTPSPNRTVNQRLSIAVLPDDAKTCGAGCGYLGSTGVQIQAKYFDKLYDGVLKKNEFDQVLFYELGRNFWDSSSLTPRLAFKEQDAVVTGFAVLMRFVVMDNREIPIGSFNQYSGTEFRAAVLGMALDYSTKSQYAFSNTFAIGKSPSVLGTTDLWASIMMDIASRHGGKIFFKRFLEAAATTPRATSTREAVNNWVDSCSRAASVNLYDEFSTKWKIFS